MACLIAAESAIFTIFVVAYLFYLGQSLSGPTPRQVLRLPILNSICLISSSLTIMLALRALGKGARGTFLFWWAATIALGEAKASGGNETRIANAWTTQPRFAQTTFDVLHGLVGGPPVRGGVYAQRRHRDATRIHGMAVQQVGARGGGGHQHAGSHQDAINKGFAAMNSDAASA
jgi:hypothetical protein